MPANLHGVLVRGNSRKRSKDVERARCSLAVFNNICKLYKCYTSADRRDNWRSNSSDWMENYADRLLVWRCRGDSSVAWAGQIIYMHRTRVTSSLVIRDMKVNDTVIVYDFNLYLDRRTATHQFNIYKIPAAFCAERGTPPICHVMLSRRTEFRRHWITIGM